IRMIERHHQELYFGRRALLLEEADEFKDSANVGFIAPDDDHAQVGQRFGNNVRNGAADFTRRADRWGLLIDRRHRLLAEYQLDGFVFWFFVRRQFYLLRIEKDAELGVIRDPVDEKIGPSWPWNLGLASWWAHHATAAEAAEAATTESSSRTAKAASRTAEATPRTAKASAAAKAAAAEAAAKAAAARAATTE